jgi:hypothetical protein
MRISAAFPSEYLKAADLQGRQVQVKISRIEMKDIGEEPKPVLHFEGKDKGLVLNKTNANTISAAFGDETDEWVGEEIILYETAVEFQGRRVQGIRCRVPPRQRQRQPATKIDDDIPF